jgi:hypothetical protein
MFGFEDEVADELGSQGRFQVRKSLFKNKWVHYFWWIVHNCVAHMCLGICPMKWSFDFHDWTSRKLNNL